MWSYEADKNFCVFAGKEPQNFMPVWILLPKDVIN
jgi:hypothetical protein